MEPLPTGLRRWLRELRPAMRDLLLPPTCPGCGLPGAGLCEPCRVHLLRRTPPWCPRCGEPLLQEGGTCPRDHRDLAGIRWQRAPFAYAGTGGALVRRLKFASDFGALRDLAVAMAAAAGDALAGPWRRAVLVPVPLHRARRRARGFDQAMLLAEEVRRCTGLSLAAGVLRRTRCTLPQGDPRVTARERNVAGAFAVVRGRPVRAARIVIVDDVGTSLATARTCAAVLRAAGAEEVALLTACRA